MTRFGHRDPIARVKRLVSGRKPRPDGPRPIRVVGHRGAPRHLPENTIESLRRAIELGADAVETDVCATRDDALVLWHDNVPSAPISLARGIGTEDFDYSAKLAARLSSGAQAASAASLRNVIVPFRGGHALRGWQAARVCMARAGGR